jgi:hypothetical protein
VVEQPPFQLAERVAAVARGLGIETAIIGAAALAVHNYVRGTNDVDFAAATSAYEKLPELERALRDLGLNARIRLPDDSDPLGGVVRVWEREDDDGEPVESVEVVNFLNPWLLRRTPAPEAIRNAVRLDAHSELRYVRLPDLIALKLYSGALADQADVVEVLARNPEADLDEIRATSAAYGFADTLEPLIAAAALRVRRG